MVPAVPAVIVVAAISEEGEGEERGMRMLNDKPIRDRDAQRIEGIVKFLFDGGVIISEGRKPAVREALIMTFELGYTTRIQEEEEK